MISRMSDRPFYAPDLQQPVRTAVPGERLWELRKGAHVVTCELRDDTRREAGVDVQVLENGELIMTQRVARSSAARSVAEWLRRDYLQSGWSDAS